MDKSNTSRSDINRSMVVLMLSILFCDKSKFFNLSGRPGGSLIRPRCEQLADLSWQEHTIGGQWPFSVRAKEATVKTRTINVVHMAKLFHLCQNQALKSGFGRTYKAGNPHFQLHFFLSFFSELLLSSSLIALFVRVALLCSS